MSPNPQSSDVPVNRPDLVNRTFLQYRILEKLGAGGMGEVYKARDTRLNRFVAIKVLSSGVSGDPQRRRRFIKEAQAASALNHPNIITIYDIVSQDETQYMIIEYIDGKALVDLIPPGGMPVAQAARYAAHIADALSAAHNAGIIHRDLKPANIMIGANGFLKLLDFGLAKMVEPESAIAGDASTRTMAPAMTVEGALMGTVNYMSPEQAEGRKLDARSDVFSFGCVLYEMLTGRRAFQGDSTVAILSAVLRDDVRPMKEFAARVPPQIEQVVARCLKKNPADRYQSMREVQAVLAPWKHQPEPVAPKAPTEHSKSVSGGLITIVVLALLGGAGYWWTTRGGRETPPVPHSRTTAREVASPPGVEAPPSKPAAPAELSDGTPVQLKLTEDIPANATAGESIRFEVVDDVRAGDSLVIRKGASVTGAIVDGPKKMTLRLETVQSVDGDTVKLRATSGKSRGVSKRAVETPHSKKSKGVAAAAGTVYIGYVDRAR